LQRQPAGAQNQWPASGFQFAKGIEPTHIALIRAAFDLKGKQFTLLAQHKIHFIAAVAPIVNAGLRTTVCRVARQQLGRHGAFSKAAPLLRGGAQFFKRQSVKLGRSTQQRRIENL